jgi:TPR repeat protein
MPDDINTRGIYMIKILIGCLLILCNFANAQTLDILADDELVSPNAGDDVLLDLIAEESDDAQNIDTAETEENSTFFSFISKPLSFLFSADEVVTTKEGKKETFLERSIRLANEGNLEDQLNLGYMYLYGTNGVNQDYDEAFKYYTMAASQNDPIALNNLGSLYFNGIGTKRDIPSAIDLFTRSADLGNDNAATNLAFIYLQGGAKDVKRNLMAINLFKASAEKGNSIAKFMLGYVYYKGFVVEKNYVEAFKLIKESALSKGKLDEAQLILAEMFASGHGTVQNYSNSVKMYREAVNQGNFEAYVKLANIYQEGKMYPQNLVLAHALYNIASVDNPQAATFRDNISKKLKLEDLTLAQTNAQEFVAKPSELTKYVRDTFGSNIRKYIDINM